MTTFKDWQFFADDRAVHVCCSCCNGYCILGDSGREHELEEELYAITVAGVDYISDRRNAVLAELIDTECGEPIRFSLEDGKSSDLAIPNAKPQPSAEILRAAVVERMDTLGIEICQGSGSRMVQHLYLGDRHIGWTMPVNPVSGHGMRLHHRHRIKGIAERLTHGGNFGVHPWDLAILALDSVQPGWLEADDE